MIIGLCGLIGSGKGTVADILVTQGYRKLSFADRLKDGVAAMFGWDRKMLEGDTEESRKWREELDFFWTRETGGDVTPRLVLQLYGTECMRDGFFDGVWVSLVKQELLKHPNDNFVIPDVRFQNEIKMIQSLGGQIWRVRRGLDPIWLRRYEKNNIIPSTIHPSEWDWATAQMDRLINNDSDKSYLKSQVADHLAST